MTVEEVDLSSQPRGIPALDGAEPALAEAMARDGLTLSSCVGEVLRPSRFRPVYRYRVGDGAGDEPAATRIFIGKADHRSGVGETYAYMQALWAAGLRGEDGLGIPEPIAHLAESALLLQTEAPGACLYDWLPVASEGLAEARNAGRFLGRLHELSLPGAKELPEDYESTKLGKYRDGLAEVWPEAADRVDALTATVLDQLAATSRGPVVPTHGDYQPKNIYVDGDRVTVIDWDRGGMGHPGRDLGHFLGQSLTMSWVKTGSFAAIRPWNEAFLDGYQSLAPAGWEPAVPAFVARTILEVLYYKLVVKPVKVADFVDEWLDELERSLA